MEKKNSKTYILVVIGIISVIVITISITYAYWKVTKEQTGVNVVNSACLDVNIEKEQDDILLNKAYPISDEEGLKLTPYKFIVTNKCDSSAYYNIGLEMLDETDLISDYVKYSLSELEIDANDYEFEAVGSGASNFTGIEDAVFANKTLDICQAMADMMVSYDNIQILEECHEEANTDNLYIEEDLYEGDKQGVGFKSQDSCQSYLEEGQSYGAEIITECEQPEKIYTFKIGFKGTFDKNETCQEVKDYYLFHGSREKEVKDYNIIKDCESVSSKPYVLNNSEYNIATTYDTEEECNAYKNDLGITDNCEYRDTNIKDLSLYSETNIKNKILGTEKEEKSLNLEGTKEGRYLLSDSLNAKESKGFGLRLWLNGDVKVEDDAMNKIFKSKIVVTSEYIEEEKIPPTVELALSVCDQDITANITGKSNGKKSIEKYEYKIDSNEWQDGSEVNELVIQEEGKHTIKARVTDNKGIVSEEVEKEVNIVKPEAEIAGMQVPVTTCKNGLYKVEHNNLSELGSEWNKTEYRYAGLDPDNYVEFNNEKWRIIGLVNVKTKSGIEQRVKIIRTNEIEGQKDFGSYAWDRSYNWTNNWTTSKLKNMLNGIYYNSESGECYTAPDDSNSTQKQCDFSTGESIPKGLNDIARQMIDSEVIWNIGGWKGSDVTADIMYEKERGTTTYNTYPSEWTNENDETYHKGIGLMYPSDYGYAVGGDVRNICLEGLLSHYVNLNCHRFNWLRSVRQDTWTITPSSEMSDFAYRISYYGYLIGYMTSYAYGVAPVAYLLPSVTIYDGDGSFDNPFKLLEEPYPDE